MEAPGLNPAHHPTLGKAHKKLVQDTPRADFTAQKQEIHQH
jgi:hypothetical protein